MVELCVNITNLQSLLTWSCPSNIQRWTIYPLYLFPWKCHLKHLHCLARTISHLIPTSILVTTLLIHWQNYWFPCNCFAHGYLRSFPFHLLVTWWLRKIHFHYCLVIMSLHAQQIYWQRTHGNKTWMMTCTDLMDKECTKTLQFSWWWRARNFTRTSKAAIQQN